MSKISNIAGGRRFRYALLELLKPHRWLFEIRQSRQRKQRGWSDRDTWDTGNYILELTAGMLKKLGDDKSHIDWDQYFVTNYPNNLGYNSLPEVAADIDAYLAFERGSWYDNLGFEVKHKVIDGVYTNVNTPEENALIKKAINDEKKQYDKLFKKANKAMQFVSYNFPALWD